MTKKKLFDDDNFTIVPIDKPIAIMDGDVFMFAVMPKDIIEKFNSKPDRVSLPGDIDYEGPCVRDVDGVCQPMD